MDRIIELTLEGRLSRKLHMSEYWNDRDWPDNIPRAKLNAMRRRKKRDHRRRKSKQWMQKYQAKEAERTKFWAIRRLEKRGIIWDKSNWNANCTSIFIDWPLDKKKGGCECFLEYPMDPRDY